MTVATFEQRTGAHAAQHLFFYLERLFHIVVLLSDIIPYLGACGVVMAVAVAVFDCRQCCCVRLSSMLLPFVARCVNVFVGPSFVRYLLLVAQVRGTVEVLALEKLTPLQNEQWGRLCSFVQRLHADELVPQRLLLVLLSVS